MCAMLRAATSCFSTPNASQPQRNGWPRSSTAWPSTHASSRYAATLTDIGGGQRHSVVVLPARLVSDAQMMTPWVHWKRPRQPEDVHTLWTDPCPRAQPYVTLFTHACALLESCSRSEQSPPVVGIRDGSDTLEPQRPQDAPFLGAGSSTIICAIDALTRRSIKGKVVKRLRNRKSFQCYGETLRRAAHRAGFSVLNQVLCLVVPRFSAARLFRQAESLGGSRHNRRILY